MSTRIEKDSMGEMEVPQEALWGASTQRAVLNFPISYQAVDPTMISAYGAIKLAAAKTNQSLGLLDQEKTSLIDQACREIIEGDLDQHFPVDVYQTGSGTSTNMNVNEVISNRCSQIAGNDIGAKDPVHPNDHVNMGQSSNDTFPTAIHIAVATSIKNLLIPSLEKLATELEAKQNEFWETLKIGRTHLMDATPVRLGQEFKGYAQQLRYSIDRSHKAIKALRELPLGGTAVGTGLNCHPEFSAKAISIISEETQIDFVEAKDHFEAQASKDGLAEVSGQLKTIATSLFKIANDIRWLSSGPRCGIGEIRLPATQPGSSIMPGKVNPVMSEALMQVCAKVIGNDSTATWCVANGNFELNVMMPAMAQSILESVRLLSNATTVFSEKCVKGIEANQERCEELIEYSLAMVTSLNSKIGYDKASQIAKESAKTLRSVREICMEHLEELGISEEELTAALDPASMTEPSV